MAGGFKKIIDALNQPIGSSGKTSDKKKEANMKLKTMELTPADAIKPSIRCNINRRRQVIQSIRISPINDKTYE